MTKAQQIIDLLQYTDLDNKQIAAKVGTADSYVRTVKQRLIAGGKTPSDKAWRKANIDRVRSVARECMRRLRAKRRAEKSATASRAVEADQQHERG